MSPAPLRVLSRDFYDRDPRLVGPDLLGKILVRRQGRQLVTGRIVEVEAYLGPEDPAAHASIGKTQRNAVLFGPPGHAYVYFIYGNHYCLNVSCLPDGVPGGVLFRAFEPVAGVERMADARGIELATAADHRKISDLRKISSGPGRMAEVLDVTRARDNEKSFVSPHSDLRLVDDGYRVRHITVTARIGITKSADHPLRYFIAGNPFVSGRTSL